MKLSKNTWKIIAVVGVIVLIYWLMSKNKKEESGFYDKKSTRKGGSSLGDSEEQRIIGIWKYGSVGTCWIGSQCNCDPHGCHYVDGIGKSCCIGTIPRPVQGGGSAGVN